MDSLDTTNERNASYRKAYKTWVKKLSPKDRAKLDKKTLKPVRTSAKISQAGDFAESIGESIGDIDIEIDIEITDEDQRFDELLSLAPSGLNTDLVRQFVRNIITAEARNPPAETEDSSSRLLLSVWRRILMDALAAEKPRLMLRVTMIALGWADDSTESIRAVARDNNLSPEGASKMVDAAMERYHLPKNQFNKTASETLTYQQTNGK